MSDDSTRGWFSAARRDTSQLDLGQGSLVPPPRDTQLITAERAAVGGHDTVQVDRAMFASDRVPSPAIATGDRTPDPMADTGSVDVSGVRLRTVEQHLD